MWRIPEQRRNGPSGQQYWSRRLRPLSRGRRAKPRYYRSTVRRTRRSGNSNPRGAEAGSWTPSALGWHADAAPWRRAPRSLRAWVPCSRIRAALSGSLEAAPPRRAVSEVAVRPSRPPRRGGGGPARSVATWRTGCGSAPPSPAKCGRTVARCARPSRRTVSGRSPHRHHPCLCAQDGWSRPCRRPLPPTGPLRRVQPRSSTTSKWMTGRTRTPRKTRAKTSSRSALRETTKPASAAGPPPRTSPRPPPPLPVGSPPNDWCPSWCGSADRLRRRPRPGR